jgi:transposase-like protein
LVALTNQRLGRKEPIDLSRISLHGFIAEAIEPGSTIRTDGLNAYRELQGYLHDRQVQRRQTPGDHLLPRVHRVISLLKRWLMGTHQGAIANEHLDDYLNEFVFRFNRRTSAIQVGLAGLVNGFDLLLAGLGVGMDLVDERLGDRRRLRVQPSRGQRRIY